MRRSLVLILCVLISLQFVFAEQIIMENSYQQSETITITLVGEFITPITQENVYFYRNNTRLPLLYDVIQIQDTYFIYAIAPESSGKYRLEIPEIDQKKGKQIITSDIQKNFTVTNFSADFNIYPGAAITKNETLFTLENLQESTLTITIETPQDTNEITLRPYSSEKVKIFLNEPENQLSNITFSSDTTEYTIPIFLLKNSSTPTNEDIENTLRFYPNSLDLTLKEDTSQFWIVYLSNKQNKSLDNISLDVSDSLSDFIDISDERLELLPDETMKIRLIGYAEERGVHSGFISVKYNDEEIILPITLEVISQSGTSEEKYEGKTPTLCEEIRTKTCLSNQTCVGKVQTLANGKICCLGYCEVPETQETQSSNRWIGWFLLLIVVLAAGWAAKRQWGN